jgi:hypothetical protein
MPVTFTNLGASTGTTEQAPDIRNLTDATSYTIPSWNPPDDGIVVLCIFSGENAGNIGITSVTGNGDVWEQIDTIEYPVGAETRTLDVYAARGEDLTTGITTIDFSPNTEIYCYVSIFHIQGADEAQAMLQDTFTAQPTVDATGTGTGTGTIDFAAPASAGNRALIVGAHTANEAITVDAGYTKLDDMNGAGPAMGIVTAFDPDGVSDAAFTWTTSTNYAFLGFEIREAVTTQETPKFTRPGRRVPKALFGPAINDGNPQVFYTVPAGIRTLVRFVHVSNAGGAEEEFRLAVGDPDVDANRILNWVGGGNGIPANSYRNRTLSIWLNPGETLQGYTSGSLSTIRIDGYERPAG